MLNQFLGAHESGSPSGGRQHSSAGGSGLIAGNTKVREYAGRDAAMGGLARSGGLAYKGYLT